MLESLVYSLSLSVSSKKLFDSDWGEKEKKDFYCPVFFIKLRRKRFRLNF